MNHIAFYLRLQALFLMIRQQRSDVGRTALVD